MRIIDLELSPFPQLISSTIKRLQFTKKEIAALKRAADILEEADEVARKYYTRNGHNFHGEPSLGDLDDHLSTLLFSGDLRDVIDAAENRGLPIEDI